MNMTMPCKLKESEVTQSCPTLSNPMDCSLPGSSVHGIIQARVLEWVATSYSRGSSPPRDWTQVSLVSHIAVRRFTVWATREAHKTDKWCQLDNWQVCCVNWQVIYVNIPLVTTPSSFLSQDLVRKPEAVISPEPAPLSYFCLQSWW